jgi:hypothetical protein
MAIELKNVHISGARTGIKADGPVDIVAENVTFDNVHQPWDISGARSVDVRGTRIKNDPKQRGSASKKASIGWSRPNGPPLPAFCSTCKTIFPSRNYNFGGQYFNAWDNEETCPECGSEHAILSEGLFDLTQATVTVLSAPDFTHAMLQSAKRVAEDLIAGKLDEPEARTRLEQISPRFKELIGKAPSFLYNAVMLVATIICAYYTYMAYEYPKEQPQQPTAIVEHVLEHMCNTTITTYGVTEQAVPTDHRSAMNPAKSKRMLDKTPTVLKQHKPKSRQIRREQDRKRREAFRGSR